MQFRTISLCSLGLLAVIAACGERSTPTSNSDGISAPATRSVARPGERARLERLAEQLARALADSAFRARLKADLDGSPVAERKLHFQRFLMQGPRPAAADLARMSSRSVESVQAEALAARGLELYFPVPEHRSAWRGGADVLVATAVHDHEAPVAFDVRGTRHVLSADRPPETPVLALVPVETDFDAPPMLRLTPSGEVCRYGEATAPPGIGPSERAPAGAAGGVTTSGVSANCPGTGRGAPPSNGGSGFAPGLWMTYASFNSTFEGWLKGAPEFEVHVLGQAGTTDSLTSYQCAGATAGGPSYFDQNATTWTGNVLLASQAQLDSYKQQHPGQGLRIVVLEDDDGACQIKLDGERVRRALEVIDAAVRQLGGGRDTLLTALQRVWHRANAFQNVLRAVWSVITTQDEFVGNAVEDVAAGEYRPGANWIVRGEHNVTNGALQLVMR